MSLWYKVNRTIACELWEQPEVRLRENIYYLHKADK